MKTKILDFIDFDKVNALLEGFNHSTGFVTAIVDLEGNVISKSGWRPICTEFHRINPETLRKCKIADTELAGKLAEGEKYHLYKCLNGLTDAAVPIIIRGEHIANLFSGQFFLEKPDTAFFKRQAEKYGFSESSYLKALESVPVFTNEQVKAAMDFLTDMTVLISEITCQKLDLVEQEEQRNKNEALLRENEEKYRMLFDNSLDAIFLTEPGGAILAANQAACKMLDRTEDEIRQLGRQYLIDSSDPKLPLMLEEREKTGRVKGELYFYHKDGRRIPCEITSVIFTDAGGQKKTSMIVRDITDRKQAEEQNNRINRVFTVLGNINKSIVRIHDKQLLAGEVCRIIVENGGFRMAWIGMVNEATKKVDVVASAGLTGDYLKKVNIDLNDAELSSGPSGMAIKTGKSVFSNDIANDVRMAPWRENALKHGFRSSIALPVFINGKVTGTCSIYAGETGSFIDNEIQLLEQMASDLSIAFEFIESEKMRKQAEEELEKNSTLLLSIIEGTSDAIYVKDIHGKYLMFNREAEHFTGKKSCEVLGKDDTFLFSAGEAAAVMDGDRKVIAEGKTASYEENVTTCDGMKRTFLSTKGPIRDKNGIIAGLFGVARDITELKRVHEVLQQREYLLSASQRAAHVGTWNWKVGDSKVFWSEETYRIYGLDPAMGQPDFEFFFEIIHPDDRLKMQEWPAAVIAGLHPGPVEFRVQLPDGNYRTIQTDGDVIETRDGVPSRIAGTAFDITGHREAEERLRLSEEQYRMLFEYSPDGIVMADPQFYYTDVNASICRMLGYTREEMIGMHSSQIVVPKEVPRISDALYEKLQTGSGYKEEWLFMRKDGSTFLAEVISTTMPDGKPIGIIRDITDRKNAEKALNLKHELFRTTFNISPLAAVLTRLPDRTIVEVNAAFERLFGYTYDEVIGTPVNEIDLWADPAERKRVDGFLLETGKVDGLEFIFRTKSGRTGYGIFYSEVVEQPDEKFVLTKVLDITESKLANEALRRSEEKFSNVFHVGPAGLTITRIADGKLLDVNESFLRMFGFEREEAVGHTSVELNMLTPEERSTLIEIQRETGGVDNYELRAQTRSGAAINLLVSSKPIELMGEECHVTTMIDITARKQAEELIKAKNSLLKIAGEIAKLGGWNVDLHDNRCYWSDEVAAIHEMPEGYSPLVEEGINFYAPEWREKITKVFTDCASRGIPYDEEMEIITSTGRRVWVRTIGEAVRDDHGKICMVQGAFMDISERKIQEARIREKDLQFRKLSANLPDMIFQFTRKPDGSYKVPIASEGIRNIFGCDPEDVTDDFEPIARVLHPEDSKRVIRDIEDSARNMTYFTCEFRVQIPGKPLQWIFSRSTPERLPDGSITWYGFNADITHRKAVEEALQQLNDELEKRVADRTSQLEAANRELEAFSYSVSHDLRAPLRHINGYVDLLNSRYHDDLPEKARHYLTTVTDSAKRMGKLIDDLLLFSRSSRQEIRKTGFDMNILVEEVLATIIQDVRDRDITWTIQDMPRVYGDYSMLKLVWANLLDNAVKYTKYTASAEIAIECREEQENFVFLVRDNGVGFDMKYAHKLFGVFQRLHSQAEFEGTGIGLANVQRIVHKHQGLVWAEAQPGLGATFFFTLPKNKEG